MNSIETLLLVLLPVIIYIPVKAIKIKININDRLVAFFTITLTFVLVSSFIDRWDIAFVFLIIATLIAITGSLGGGSRTEFVIG